MKDTLVPAAAAGESAVVYRQMMGDYFRYIAELTDGDPKKKAAEDARAKDLAVAHPIRLGLALNYSVFQYKVLHNHDEACNMARTAFEDAIAELDNVAEDSYTNHRASSA